jgi:very-short-patch-repair endonuclease
MLPTIVFARSLRGQMTPQEIRLWVALRAMRAQGYRFRRQSPFGPYILDFVCHRHRLAIEVDGSQHFEGLRMGADRRRDAFLAAAGYTTLRFSNADVNVNLDGVVDTIQRQLGAPLT